MVTFNEVPATIRVPGIYVEVGASTDQAVTGDQPYRIGIIGQMLPGGTAIENEPIRITRAADALVLFGAGSMLAQAAAAALANVSFVDLWAIPMVDPDGGSAATGSIAVSAVDARAGTIAVYAVGERIPVAISAGLTAAEIAERIAEGINGSPTAGVTATADAGTVTVTAVHLGTIGNELGLALASGEGETLPTGVTATVTAMSGGAGEPDITSALAALGDAHYNIVVAPYQEPAILTEVVTEMEDRASATRQLGGVAFTASTGNLAALTTLGLTQNSERMVIVGASGSPSAPWQWASAVAGHVANDAPGDPARPYTGVGLQGVRSGASNNRLIATERNILLMNGIATVGASNTGAPQVERLITTYRTNDLGGIDLTFLDLTSILTLERLRFDLRATLTAKFGRFKVGDDGEAFAPGTDVITPNGMRAEVIALYAGWVEQGWVEGSDDFAASLIVERDPNDPTRINISTQPNVANALRVVGALVSLVL